ncbi:HEXXH motif domain-containing protein [Nonomuraea zeae]|uniref:HEXXH motif domain-containing protein n=1 Tax=Nonomuraea zeae TaxID=1642303 RepID=A0A5S4G6Y6_9ACTN|nr:HEXXH motif domain-containing protein [Nonomuraea zeae]TMR28785.1 HEXXH motif domain-containing protein [Nonomuraea zeae]
MNLTEHRIPADAFDALASGGGGGSAVRQLSAAQYSKHLLLIRGVLNVAREAGHARWTQTRRAYDLLATLQSQYPEAVDRVLQHPSVGAWARHTIRTRRYPEQLAALAAAVALRARTTCEVDVPVIDGKATLPSLGQVTFPDGVTMATVHCWPEGAEVSAGGIVIEIRDGVPGWQGLRTLTAESAGKRLDLLIDDLDPHRMPGANDLRERLTSAQADHWRRVLEQSWELLVSHHAPVADEVSAAITVLTPLDDPAVGASSGTSRDAYGCIALSTPPDPRTLAETLTHEGQHAKLSALLDIVRLTKPDDGSRYYAPWREDPRPAGGLLQGSYAYLGVTDFWRRQRHHETGESEIRASAEFARWRSAARLVTGTLLDSGRLTEHGVTFVDRMGRQLDAWADEPVPAQAAALATRAADRHRERWRRANGEPG